MHNFFSKEVRYPESQRYLGWWMRELLHAIITTAQYWN